MTPYTGKDKDERAKRVFEIYRQVKEITRDLDILDLTTLVSMLTVDYVEKMGQIDNILNFMDDYKLLIMKQARSKRGYS